MERVKLYCRGECHGEIVLRPEGSRTEVRAVMADPGDGLYRAALCGESGEILLGVLAPKNGALEVGRMLYSRDIAALGPLLRGEARCSFQFQERGWQETRCPAELLEDSFFRERLANMETAWWRRDGKLLYLALPVAEDRPFPLETLFCLARLERVGGRVCAVYAFRGDEPVLP